MWKCKTRINGSDAGARIKPIKPVAPGLQNLTPRRHALAIAIAGALAFVAAPESYAHPATSASTVSDAVSQAAQWRVALHYGADAPLHQLRAFDIVVVEPGHSFEPRAYRDENKQGSELYAYVSVGEIRSNNAKAARLPEEMLAGENRIWKSRIVDTAHPDWPKTLVERVITPLWQQGYRGFFLDTLDAYHALPSTPRQRASRRQGVIDAISLIKATYPQAQLIANRGFELLAEIHGSLQAVAAESLYGRWNQANKRYERVPEGDRRWLLDRFNEARALGLKTLSIDYAPETEPEKHRDLAGQILAHGITPYVTTGAINAVGTGPIQVVPRTVLVVHDGSQDGDDFESMAQRLLAMPLHYLGYRVQLLDIRHQPVPPATLRDRYAGVFGMFNDLLDGKQARQWLDLLKRAREDGLRVGIVNGFGARADQGVSELLNLTPIRQQIRGIPTMVTQTPGITGYETAVLPGVPSIPVRADRSATPLIRQQDDRNATFDTVALTSWGGFALAPHAYQSHRAGENWVIDPIRFVAGVLGQAKLPMIPDVTTENGRRLLLVHIDGDGFASRAEVPGSPWAAQIMLDDFITRYPVPHTVSVIEGEIGPKGLYPWYSRQLESIARDIFALDHVELATHSYSHPFFWRAAYSGQKSRARTRVSAGRYADADKSDKPYLPIDGYEFSLERDILGSARYIDERLAPPGKRTRMMLWTGDCNPPGDAIAIAKRGGLLNMNAGDTTISRRTPTLTQVAPMSIRKNGQLQVFAPNQNENVYTNDWTGPFYGYERVIETFEMTNSPRRLKPINIYYHTYSASKHASITALHKVYRYALSQPVNPIYSSEYAQKVIDYEAMTISRLVKPAGDDSEGVRWEIHSGRSLRTVRIDTEKLQRIDWSASQGLAGFEVGVDGTYLHLGGKRAQLTFSSQAVHDPPPPLLAWASGRISDVRRDPNRLRFRLTAYDRSRIGLRHEPSCKVRIGARPVRAIRSYRPHGEPNSTVYEYGIERDASRSGTLVSVNC